MRNTVANNLEEQVSGVTEDLHSALLAAGDPLSECARALQARPTSCVGSSHRMSAHMHLCTLLGLLQLH